MTAPAAVPADHSHFVAGGRTGFLLMHGLGGTPVELRYVALALGRAGYTVSCPQLAGHCQTHEALRLTNWRDWYASVEAAHDRLKQHCDTVIAGGLSMGSLLAAHLAHERPAEIAGLVLYAPTLVLDGWAMPWYARPLRWIRPTPLRMTWTVAERFPYGFKSERVRALALRHMQAGDSAEAGLFATPIRAVSHFNVFVAMLKKELGRIRTPTLIMHPREDDVASLANAFHLQRHLGGPVEMVVLDDCYHMITLDRQRQQVIDRTLAFATGLAARTGGSR